MRKIKGILLMFLLLIVAGCSVQKSTFEKELKKVLELDSKYNASFYTEALDKENWFSDYKIYDFDWNRTTVNINDVPWMVEELEKMREEYYKKEMTDDNKAILLLIKARIKMLESQRMYLLGKALGTKGDTYDGFRCSEKPFILNASHYFNESTRIGQEATGILDDLLTYFPQTRMFLSESERPKFYDSPFWPIGKYAMWNKATVQQLCRK